MRSGNGSTSPEYTARSKASSGANCWSISGFSQDGLQPVDTSRIGVAVHRERIAQRRALRVDVGLVATIEHDFLVAVARHLGASQNLDELAFHRLSLAADETLRHAVVVDLDDRLGVLVRCRVDGHFDLFLVELHVLGPLFFERAVDRLDQRRRKGILRWAGGLQFPNCGLADLLLCCFELLASQTLHWTLQKDTSPEL